jgi:hypothetical protein
MKKQVPDRTLLLYLHLKIGTATVTLDATPKQGDIYNLISLNPQPTFKLFPPAMILLGIFLTFLIPSTLNSRIRDQKQEIYLYF